MVPMEGFSEIDPENGEDEFVLTDFDTSVSSVTSSSTHLPLASLSTSALHATGSIIYFAFSSPYCRSSVLLMSPSS
jgi:hypothetical protein